MAAHLAVKKHLGLGCSVSWKFPPIGQSFHLGGEIRHLIEIGLELVPAQR